MPALDPHSQAADAVHEGRPVEAQYVRQGRRGTHVLVILLASLALVLVGFLAVWGLHMGPFATADRNAAPLPSEAAEFNTPNETGVKQAPAPGESPGQ